ncbi:MAG: DUF4384 domain-containing protein [Muribaculaceae bacterium]|nr:DUF4384 domain-containing protein [Muribaculaceae bacterium]
MKRLLFLLSLIIVSYSINAQQTSVVSANYTYYAPESMSVEEAKHIALERAKIEAIAAKFGTKVSQSNTIVLSNTNAVSNTQLYSVGGSEVKGEWIETIGEPLYQISYNSRILIVSVTAKGRIKESEVSKPQIEVKTYRNSITQNNETTEFWDGDDFYMTALPLVNGYMIAYLFDETTQKAYRILPYQQDKSKNVKLNESQTYTFFNSENTDEFNRSIIDNYNMTCEESVEFNRLYVIFSEKPISTISNEMRQNEDLTFEVDDKNFQNWLVRKRSDSNVKVLEYILKINKSKSQNTNN